MCEPWLKDCMMVSLLRQSTPSKQLFSPVLTNELEARSGALF